MVNQVVKDNSARAIGFLVGFGVTLFVLLFLVTAPFNPVVWIIFSVVLAIAVGYVFNKLAFALYGRLSNTSQLPDDALAKNAGASIPLKKEKEEKLRQPPELLSVSYQTISKAAQKMGGAADQVFQEMREVDPPLKPIALSRIPYRELKFDRRMGKEGISTVYRGHWKGQPVAIKLLSISLSSSTNKKFAQEIAILDKLEDPGIVQCLGICLEDRNAYLVMEWMPKGSLYGYLTKNKLEPRQQKEIALDIVKGLHYLHEKGVINKNLRSRNILLTDDCRAKISDFGLAKVSIYSVQTLRKIKSSICWWAPELLRREEITAKADVYSLGVVLWELFTGRRPFAELSKSAESSKSTLREKIIAGHREELPETLPKKIRDLITACWSGNPSERPELTEIMKRLEAYEPVQLQTAETHENEEKTLGK